MADRDGGLVFDAKNQTVGEYLERWLNDSVRGSVKPVTFENRERLVRNHIAMSLGHVKLKNLTPAHIQGFYRAKLDAGLAPSSVRLLHAILHKALKQAVRWELLPRNACEAVDPPKLQTEEIQPLDADQAKALLEAARGDRLEALYVLAVTAGLRIGELLGLKWEDVDLKRGVLHVRRTQLGAGLPLPHLRMKRGGALRSQSGQCALSKFTRQHRTPRGSRSPPVYGKIGDLFSLLGAARPSTTVTSPAVTLNCCFRVLSCPERYGSTTSGIRALPCSLAEACILNSCKNCSDMPTLL
jgi:integrase